MSKTIFGLLGLVAALSFTAPSTAFACGDGQCAHCQTKNGKKSCPHHTKNGKKGKKDCDCAHEHSHDEKKEAPKS